LILTLLGWPVARLAPGSPAHALNLFAGALAGMTVGLICLVALRMARVAGGSPSCAEERAMAAGVGAGALTFAFSGTLWVYAVRFTPYVLTPVFTGFILLVMLRWWELAGDDDAWRWILVLTLLFGLDFSVHRTNGLLIPGAIGWIAIRRPITFLSPRAVAAALSASFPSGVATGGWDQPSRWWSCRRSCSRSSNSTFRRTSSARSIDTTFPSR
jgi:hypothetical protein